VGRLVELGLGLHLLGGDAQLHQLGKDSTELLRLDLVENDVELLDVVTDDQVAHEEVLDDGVPD
jgi:hypothetical protein